MLARRAVAGATLVLMAMAACAGPSEPAGDGASAVSSSTTATPERPLTIAFAGDVHFTGRTEPHLDDPDDLIAALKPLADADLAIVNLETAITERGTPEPKSFHFRAPARSLDVLKHTGVDAVSIANNHTVDYGPVGLQDTLTAVESSPIPVVGIGKNADEAYKPAILTARGHKVALIGASQVYDRTLAAFSAGTDKAGIASATDVDRMVVAVEQARGQADTVVVYLHWGTENTGCPNPQQKSLAKRLSAAGADIIVGPHAHQLQGAGWTADGATYVDYGLGNFVWWRSNSKRSVTTGVLTLTVDGRQTTAAAWTPMTIDSDGLPQQDADPAEGLANFDKIRGCTDLQAERPAG